MVRSALAMVRLLHSATREDPAAPERRAEQRRSGQTVWGLRDGLISDDLRGVLPPAHEAPPTAPAADPLADFDRPLPMDPIDETPTDEVVVVRGGLRVG